MGTHPIENMMAAAFDNVRAMVDVDTVVGEATTTETGQTIIPISRVSFGFAGGGGEYGDGLIEDGEDGTLRSSFAGGSGAGVSIAPVGFLVIDGERVSMLRADGNGVAERLTELFPKLVDELCGIVKNACERGKEREGTRHIYIDADDED